MLRFKRATTLLELTVSMAAGLVLLTAATMLTTTVLRKVFWIEESSDRQLLALNAVQQARRDLLRSSLEGCKIDGDAQGPTLALAQLADSKAQTVRLWLDAPVIWGNQDGRLLRAERPPGAAPTSAPPLPGPAQVREFLSSAPEWSRRVFAGVTLKEVKQEDGRLIMRLTTSMRTFDGQLRPQELSSVLGFRE